MEISKYIKKIIIIYYREKCPVPHDNCQIKNDEDKYKYFAEDKEQSFCQKIIEFKDPAYSIKMLLSLYMLAKIINIFNEKFIAWVILNIIIFYGPIEKKYPYFLFKSRMFVQQIFEGIIGIICCIIPSYDPNNLKK